MTVATPARETRPATGRRWIPGGRTLAIAELVVVALLMAAAVAGHHPGRMLSRPLWLDENWVADSVRAPLGRVAALTSSTPLGFTLLLRLATHHPPPQLRVVPLAFAAAAVAPAWLLGREVQPRGWTTRLVLGAAVALMPAMLLRQDLKQYTAEAFTVLVLAWLLARADRGPSRWRLGAFGAAMAVGMLLSNAALFTGTAGFVALLAEAVLRRRWRRVREVLVVGLATLVAVAAVFFTVVRPGDTPALRAYWAADYIPLNHGVAAAVSFVARRAAGQLRLVGLGPIWVVALLVLAGLALLAWRGLLVLAVALPLVALELIAAAAAHQYPLWDTRTSTWFTALATVTAVIGLAGVAQLFWWLLVAAHRRAPASSGSARTASPGSAPASSGSARTASPGSAPASSGSARKASSGSAPAGSAAGWSPRWLSGAALSVLLGTAVVAGAAVPFTRAAASASATLTPYEDVAGQVATILAERRPGDVVLANSSAGYGLGISWPAKPEFLPPIDVAVDFRIAFPPADRVVVAAARTTPAELAAVRRAVALARARPGARIWVVLSHVDAAEQQTYLAALRAVGTLTTPPGQRGGEPVQLLTLS